MQMTITEYPSDQPHAIAVVQELLGSKILCSVHPTEQNLLVIEVKDTNRPEIDRANLNNANWLLIGYLNACEQMVRLVKDPGNGRVEDSRVANHIDGYDRDDTGESPDY